MSQPYEMTDDTFEQMARVVAVSGELDMHAAPAFEQRLLACVSSTLASPTPGTTARPTRCR